MRPTIVRIFEKDELSKDVFLVSVLESVRFGTGCDSVRDAAESIN
jgi:hypothetical protein